MAGVVPLKKTPITDSKAPRRADRKPVPGDFQEGSGTSFCPSARYPVSIDSPDNSSHRKDGIQKRTLQKLKRGRFPIEAELDLHHMKMDTARLVLRDFIAGAISGSLVSVRVIHGKGRRSKHGPKLKNMTREVLRDHPGVVAYTACKPTNGGDGAVDVLLKTS